MSTVKITCGQTYPYGTIDIMGQLLCFPGVSAEGEITGISGTVYLRRNYPGTDTIRFLITDKCKVPSGWKTTDGGCVYTEGSTNFTESTMSKYFSEDNILLDITQKVKITATGEFAAKVSFSPEDADKFVTDLSRWSGKLYLGMIRQNSTSYLLLHTAKDNRSKFTITYDQPGYDTESFLKGFVVGLMGD